MFSWIQLSNWTEHIYMSMLLSQFVPLSPSPMSICPFSMSASVSLPCKQVPMYHFFRFKGVIFKKDEPGSPVEEVTRKIFRETSKR